jgi:ankyrin repeat protein
MKAFALFIVLLGLVSCTSSAKRKEELNQRLLNACFEGTGALVTEILKAGADPNSNGLVKPYHPGNEPLSAIEIACANSSLNPESPKIVEALLKKGAKASVKALVLALDGTQTEIVSFLVTRGINVNEKATIEGRDVYPIIACLTSPISTAASRSENLQTLLKAGASPNVSDAAGETPLLAAAADPQRLGDLIDPLLSHGASLAKKGKNGKTAVDLLRDEDERCRKAVGQAPGSCEMTDAALGKMTALTARAH